MRSNANPDRGVTLIETLIAVLIAVFGVFTLGQVLFLSMVSNKNQGAEVTRATIYAQDKMEKLLSLGAPNCPTTTSACFSNCTLTASSQPSACNSTNITGSGWTQGLLAGGAIVASGAIVTPGQFSCPTSGSSVGYIDFLDGNGLQVPSGGATSCSALATTPVSYIRMWQITDLTSTGGPHYKQVEVSVYAQSAVSSPVGKPIVDVISFLSNPNSDPSCGGC